MLAIVGATGTGKSDFALDVAERLSARGVRAEVINADAMQLYRGMDVATAKLAPAERRGVPHHLLDVLDPDQDASVARYQIEARAIADSIEARGAVPLLVGGSGLYCSSVLFEFAFPATDPAMRADLEARAAAEGPAALLAELHARDPEAAAQVDPRNPRRIIRALEVARSGGSAQRDALAPAAPLARPAHIVHLATDRATLVQRLDARAERMWAGGLLDETRALMERGIERGTTARRAIGTAQAIEVVRGAIDAGEGLAQTQALTRRYARRQVSWFRRYPVDPVADRDADRVVATLLASRD